MSIQMVDLLQVGDAAASGFSINEITLEVPKLEF